MNMTLEKYLGKQIKISTDDDLDFVTAKDLAKQKIKEYCADSMLLSWCNGRTGEHYPTIKCGSSDKPAWILNAEARGGDITIDVNDGEYIFIFLSLQ
ncbi:MAG: AF1514 family protein [Deltaproteobacteria bacterium]|nr:AF1514 family protein [Deltaproteobacteria bacterium]MBW2219660.1 AF1514 family protein [Deltaproteobacteria bacterium]